MTPGYSGTPLVRKLGFKGPVWAIGAPAEYPDWVEGQAVSEMPPEPLTGVHLFVKRRAELEVWLKALRGRLERDGMVWVSWPKKAAKVETDVTEDVIRDVALPLGFVDVKVCAVSEVWSGLKLVIRLSERR
jgi:hypothetical protein